MNRWSKILAFVLLVVTVPAVLAACGPTAAPTAVPTAPPPALGTAENPIIMSFVPSGDTQEIVAGGEVLAEMLKAKTGLEIEVTVGTDFAAVREAMGAGQTHIGWLNTFNYVLAHEKYGVEVGLVTVRYGTNFYTGEIVVRADSGIDSLDDLKGKTFCWVDPNSTSGYIIPRIMLLANGVDPEVDFVKQVEAGSHNNVVAAVYNGDCDGGACYSDARSSIEADYPDVKEKVVILATTTEIPNDGVDFVKDFPADLREKVVQALVDIAATEEGKAALKTIYSIENLERADDTFYDAFRADLSKAGIDIEDLVK